MRHYPIPQELNRKYAESYMCLLTEILQDSVCGNESHVSDVMIADGGGVKFTAHIPNVLIPKRELLFSMLSTYIFRRCMGIENYSGALPDTEGYMLRSQAIQWLGYTYHFMHKHRKYISEKWLEDTRFTIFAMATQCPGTLPAAYAREVFGTLFFEPHELPDKEMYTEEDRKAFEKAYNLYKTRTIHKQLCGM